MNAIQELERALSAAKEAGDVRMACLIQGDLGASWLDLGETALAEGFLRQVVEEARRRLLTFVEIANLPDLGLALTLLGRLDEARATLNKALSWPNGTARPRASAAADLFFSMLAYVSGDFIEAEHRARLATDRLRGCIGCGRSRFRPWRRPCLRRAAQQKPSKLRRKRRRFSSALAVRSTVNRWYD